MLLFLNLAIYSACTSTISSRMCSLPGITDFSVSLVLNSAVILHDTNTVSIETLVNEIEDLGYGATLFETRELQSLRKTVFGLEGMTCRLIQLFVHCSPIC